MKIPLWLLVFVSFMIACNHKPVDESKTICENNNDRLFHRSPEIDSLAKELMIQTYILKYYNFRENLPLQALKILLDNDTNIKDRLEYCISEFKKESERTKQFNKQLGLKPIMETDYDEVYRFSLRRSFETEDAVITVSRRKDEKKIETILFNYGKGETYYIPVFSATKKAVKSLNDSQWTELISRLEKAYFWSLAPHDGNFGFDGSTWIIESKTTYPYSVYPEYHYVEKWAPYKGSAFMEIGMYMIELSGIVPGPIY